MASRCLSNRLFRILRNLRAEMNLAEILNAGQYIKIQVLINDPVYLFEMQKGEMSLRLSISILPIY